MYCYNTLPRKQIGAFYLEEALFSVRYIMPKISKLLKKSKKKGDGDAASISSKASVQPHCEGSAVHIFSYTIKKDKDLPKLHKAAWRGDTSKIKELAKTSSVNSLDKQNRFDMINFE